MPGVVDEEDIKRQAIKDARKSCNTVRNQLRRAVGPTANGAQAKRV